MGLQFHPRNGKVTDEPFWWALHSVHPAASMPNDYASVNGAQQYYRDLLLLASGIQMAGPHLDPASFSEHLLTTKFPNPATPQMEGAVGFNGTHGMTRDATEWWYDPAARSPYAGDAGTMCYVAGGRRRGPSDWSDVSGDPYYKGPCDSGA
jgi:hypothetical protein